METPGESRALWLVPSLDGEAADYKSHFVDFQRDQTVADVLRSTGAGMRSVEHVKRYTSISTANDQGKTSGVNAIGVIAAALGTNDVAGIGTTAFRAPYTPVAFAALAGRERGELFDPARLTSIHPWHVARGALFEDVGQWKRPWYYPQAGRGHGHRGLPRVRGRARLGGLHGRHHAGQDRDPRQGRRRIPEPHVHQRVQEAQARAGPLRR